MVKFGDEFAELFYNREILAKLMDSEVFRNWPTVDVSKNNIEARQALIAVIDAIIIHPHDDLINNIFNRCQKCIAIENLADELRYIEELREKARENSNSGDAQRN